MKKQQPLQRFSRDLQVGLVILYCFTLLAVLISTQQLTRTLVINNLYSQVKKLIQGLPDNGNRGDLIRYFRSNKEIGFFRVTLLDQQMQIIYDSFDDNIDKDYLRSHYKLVQALEKGYSYDEHLSSVTLKEMAYITVRFDYGGVPYLIRSSFQLAPLKGLQSKLQITFFTLSSITFLIFSLLTWLLIHRLNRPLESVLQIVSQKGPEILDPSTGLTLIEIQDLPQDFDELVNTLNGLSEQVNRSFQTLAHERNERDAILRSMAEGVLSLNPNLEILYANPAAYQILDLDPKSPLQQALFTPRFDKLRTLCQTCLESQVPIAEETDLQGSIQRSHVEILINPGFEGRINVLIRDRSQQYELSEMRKGFVANASHELRTPITIIRGFAETLRDHPEISGEKLQEIMQKIINNCERMTALITQLMNLSKIENLPTLDLTKFDLGKTVQQVIYHMLQAHPKANIQFERTLNPAWVLGQEVLLDIVVRNLVENAIKYSDGSPRIEIGLFQEGDFVQLTVQDHGIGIPENDLPYIFERFYTVDKARSKKTGGYGLGLAMVKTIVDKHGGTIQVHSKPGEGTCFIVRLVLHDNAKKLQGSDGPENQSHQLSR